ncbi:MAG: class I SAM-dependent methyltransferase [Pseudomonadota bacterium]
MSQHSKSLDQVYGAPDPATTRQLYDDWAARYDAENLANGFWLPMLAAGFVARHVPLGAGPILDAACGTGLVGRSLAVLGYADLTGLDLSPGMLGEAGRHGVYARLLEHRLGTPAPLADGSFAAAICSGAFGPGHAPPGTLDDLVRLTAPGGAVIFNVREDSYADQGFAAAMARLTEAGRWAEVERSAEFRAFLSTEPELTVRFFVFRTAG